MPNDTETMPNDTETANDKTTYETLLEAIYSEDPNFKTQEGESDRDYLIRFMENVASTPQSTFDGLPQEAQEWFNHTANAMTADANAAVKMPQGFVSVYDEGAAAPKADNKKKRGRPSGSTSTQTKAETAAKATKSRTPSVKVKSTVIREAVVANPRATNNEIAEILVQAGFKDVRESTITTIRYDSIATLRAAKSAGILNVDLDLPA